MDPNRGDLSPDGTHFYDGPDWGWQQLWLTPDRVRSFCSEDRGLPVERVDLLAEGMLNQTWKITCADHDRVLRVGRTERTVEQVRYERLVVGAWAEVADAVVAAEHDDVPVLDGHTLTLFPFCSGDSGTRVASPIRARELVPVLAAMHRSALKLDLGQRPGSRSVDDHPRWHGWERTRLAILDRFGRSREVLDPMAIVDRAIEELDRLLDGWQRSGRLDQRAPVHGDLNPRNLIFDGDRLVGIIDTDECRVDPLVWEVAGQAYSDGDVDPARVFRDYLDAGGPLTLADEELMLPLARLGQLSELVWLTGDDGEPTHIAARRLAEIAAGLGGEPVRD